MKRKKGLKSSGTFFCARGGGGGGGVGGGVGGVGGGGGAKAKHHFLRGKIKESVSSCGSRM